MSARCLRVGVMCARVYAVRYDVRSGIVIAVKLTPDANCDGR